jgi:hypothetical protein
MSKNPKENPPLDPKIKLPKPKKFKTLVGRLFFPPLAPDEDIAFTEGPSIAIWNK